VSPIIPIDLEIKSENVTILVYGYTGSGKTHFAGTARNSIFLDFEGGTATLLNVDFKGKAFHLDTASDLRQVLSWFNSSEQLNQLTDKVGFKPESVVIDTLTRMQQHTQLDILDHREIKAGKQEDVMEQKEWGRLLIQMYRLMKILPNQGFDIIALAQAREFEDPASKIIKWMPNLTGQWGDQIGAYVDIVSFLELVQTVDGRVVHRLHLQPSGGWSAKSRYKNLPKYLDDANYSDLKRIVLEARKGGESVKSSQSMETKIETKSVE